MSVHHKKREPLAIWSLVLALLSWICTSLITAIPAIICGHIALRRIKRSSKHAAGKRMALVALIISYLYLITIIIAIGYASHQIFRTMDNVNIAQNDFRKISRALELWKNDHGQYPDNLEVLVDKYLTQIPKDGFGNNYIYRVNKLTGAPPYELKSLWFDGIESKDDKIYTHQQSGISEQQ